MLPPLLRLRHKPRLCLLQPRLQRGQLLLVEGREAAQQNVHDHAAGPNVHLHAANDAQHFRVVLGPITLWGLFLKVQSTISWILVELLMLRTLEHGIPKGSDVELVLLGVAYLLNWLFSYVCDDAFRKLKLGGKALMRLRTNMFDTMLQFTPASQLDFPTGKVSKIMESQVDDALTASFETYDAVKAKGFEAVDTVKSKVPFIGTPETVPEAEAAAAERMAIGPVTTAPTYVSPFAYVVTRSCLARHPLISSARAKEPKNTGRAANRGSCAKPDRL